MSSYIGKEPTYGVFIMQSATGDGSTTTLTLNATAADATQLMVSVGGLLQKPRTAYSINTLGTTLTFSEAPASGIEIFLVFLGKQLTGPRINADAITSQTALGTSPASDDTFLIYDESSSALKKVAYSNVHSGVADMAANTVKVRDANTTGAPSDKVLTTTQILIGDGTGFTAAALSGDVLMTNAGAVTIQPDSVELDMLVDIITANRVLGSVTGGTVIETTVDTGMITDNAVTLGKMAGLVRGKIIVGDASGDPSALTVGTEDQVLTSDGTDVSWSDSVGGASWAIKTGAYTAVTGDGVMVDTDSAAITITLPISSGPPALGDFVRIMDATGNCATTGRNITVGRAGHNIQGAAADLTIATNRAAIGLVYVNATEGWVLIEN